jgi:hypothetical protein
MRQSLQPSLMTQSVTCDIDRCVMTLACGKKLYFDLAASLARSFRAHHCGEDITFVIVTDSPDKVPSDVRAWVHLVQIKVPEGRMGFELKLDLDRYTSAKKTLFIDADCLVVRSLTPLFKKLSGTSFAVIGKNKSEGEWFGAIRNRCVRIKATSLPVFVGALYYFEQGERSSRVFAKARAHASDYDEIGIVRLRGRKNEEPLISIGMALEGIPALPDDGTIKCDVMAFEGPIKVDVMASTATFHGPRSEFQLVPQASSSCHPVIAHFNDAYSQLWEYRRESMVLMLIGSQGMPHLIASVTAKISVEYPGRMKRFLKSSLRPMFHALFGFRKIKTNERL